MKESVRRRSVLFLSLLLIGTMLVSVPVSAKTVGVARHKQSDRVTDATLLPQSYNAADGSEKKRDSESIAIVFTGGVEQDPEDLSKTTTWFSDLAKKYPASVFIDTGSASLNQPMGMAYSEFPSLRMLGAAGYDWTMLSTALLAKGTENVSMMVYGAAGSSLLMPYLSCSNLTLNDAVSQSFRYYGIGEYTALTKYRRTIAMFSVIGEDQIPSGSGFGATDPVTKAKSVMEKIEAGDTGEACGNSNSGTKPDVVICMADFGSGKEALKQAEKFVKSVPGIDLLLLANQSGKVEKKVGDTTIAAVGPGADQAGVVRFQQESDETFVLESMSVKSMPKDTESSASVEAMYQSLYASGAATFKKQYGMAFESELTTASKSLGTLQAMKKAETDTGLGDLVADSYLFGAESLSGMDSGNTVSVVSTEALASGLPKGEISSSDAMNLFVDGSDAENPGLNMVSFHLYGKDLKKLAELSSNLAKEKSENRLTFGGLRYSYNPHRFSGNRVYNLTVLGADGNYAAVGKDDLVRVITDEKTAVAIEKMSSPGSSALSFALKDAKGETVDQVTTLKESKKSSSLKAWACVMKKLASFGDSGVPDTYSKSDGRVTFVTSLRPSQLLKEANGAVIVIVVISVIAVLAVLVLLLIFRHIFHGSGSHRRRRRRSGKFDSKTGRGSYRSSSHDKPIFTEKRRRRR